MSRSRQTITLIACFLLAMTPASAAYWMALTPGPPMRAKLGGQMTIPDLRINRANKQSKILPNYASQWVVMRMYPLKDRP